MSRQKKTARTLLLLVLLAPAAYTGQEQNEPGAPTQRQELFRVDGNTTLAEIQAMLDRIRLMVDVDREFSAARRGLNIEIAPQLYRLAEKGSESKDLERVMTRMFVEYGRVLVALGEYVEAQKMLRQLMSAKAAQLPYHAILEKVAMDPSIADLQRQIAIWLGDADVIQVEPGSAPGGHRGTGDRVDDAVIKASSDGNWQFLEQLGARAVPGLLQVVRADPAQFQPSFQSDALRHLFRADPRVAANEVLRLLPGSELFFRMRAVRALDTTSVLRTDVRWIDGSADMARMQTPELLVLAGELLRDDETGREVILRELEDVVARGAQTPRLEDVLADLLDTPARDHVFRLFQRHPISPVSVRFLERVLDHADPDARAWSAGLLARREWNDALARRVDDPEPRVRAAVGLSLHSRRIETWTFDEADPAQRLTQTTWINPTLDGPRRALAVRLLRDADATVRTATLPVLWRLPRRTVTHYDRDGMSATRHEVIEVLDHDLYLALARDPDPVVRLSMTRLAREQPREALGELAEILAVDTDPFVLSGFDELLHSLPWTQEPGACMRAVEKRASNTSHPFEADSTSARNAWSQAKQTDEGLNRLVAWALAQEGDSALLAVARTTISNRIDLDKRLAGLRADLLASLIPRIATLEAIGSAKERFAWIAELTQGTRDPEAPERLLSVGRNMTLPADVRYLALTPGSNPSALEDPERVALIATALLDPMWTSSDTRKFLHSRLLTLSGKDRNAALLALLADESADDMIARAAAMNYAPEAPLGDEVEGAILERWLDSPATTVKAVERVLARMKSDHERVDVDVLSRAAMNHRYDRQALRIMGQLRDPAFFPVLRRYVIEKRNEQSWPDAIDAIAGYISDEAAELLLEAAALAPFEEQREQCLQKLEGIREYQLAQERWASRRVETQTREAVVRDLLSLLDDDNVEVRVQAIRGLATFEAVEALPRLIRLLKISPEAEIAGAARAALDVLNASAAPRSPVREDK